MGMIDGSLVFCDGMAFGGTPTPVDLGQTFKPGAGAQIRGFLSGVGVTGVTAVVVKTGPTSAGADTTTVDTKAITAAKMNLGFTFDLPTDNLERWVTISFTGITAGTNINAYLSLDHQSA